MADHAVASAYDDGRDALIDRLPREICRRTRYVVRKLFVDAYMFMKQVLFNSTHCVNTTYRAGCFH